MNTAYVHVRNSYNTKQCNSGLADMYINPKL